MPTQIGSAKFVGISSVNVSLIGQKVRLVGRCVQRKGAAYGTEGDYPLISFERLLAFDALHALVTLLDSDGKHTLIVDVQDVLDETSNAWATERLGPVLVMGYVEEPAVSEPPLPTPCSET